MGEALAIARRSNLDLVEVAAQAAPPVCRIMDYGKFKFDAEQKARETRRKSSGQGLKEIKYRPKIGAGDFETKTRQVERFLGDGHKVKVTVMFRGREVFYPEFGKKILDNVAERVENVGRVEFAAKLEERNMAMVLAPLRLEKRAAQQNGERSAAHGRTEAGGGTGVDGGTGGRDGAGVGGGIVIGSDAGNGSGSGDTRFGEENQAGGAEHAGVPGNQALPGAD